MKKIALLLAISMIAATLAACDSSDEKVTTKGNGSTTTAPVQTTQGTPDETTAPKDDPTEPAETTDSAADPTEGGETGPELSYPAEDVVSIPGGKAGDLDLEGYDASLTGAWDIIDDKLTSDGNSSIFIVTNDRMSAGKLTATFTSLEGSDANDNGIVFGLEDNLDSDSFYFWEDPMTTPPYYFLFVSDAGTLYLAKVASGTAWTELRQSSSVIIGYQHGSTITISVEFDGNGNINCYANDELLIEYQDTNGPTGSRYGVRAEVPGVVYHEVIAEHAE